MVVGVGRERIWFARDFILEDDPEKEAVKLSITLSEAVQPGKALHWPHSSMEDLRQDTKYTASVVDLGMRVLVSSDQSRGLHNLLRSQTRKCGTA